MTVVESHVFKSVSERVALVTGLRLGVGRFKHVELLQQFRVPHLSSKFSMDYSPFTQAFTKRNRTNSVASPPINPVKPLSSMLSVKSM